MGLLVAGGVHTVKSAVVRPAVTVATGSAGNVPVSMAEDTVATVTSVLSIVVPVLIALALLILLVWSIWFFDRRRKAKAGKVI
jgi:heme/copper-type cytochrome/quinol oxidase subunit 2